MMFFKMYCRRIARLFCAFFLVFNPYAQAANNGTIGASSSGSLNILVTANLFIVTFGFDDIDLGTWPGIGDMVGNDSLCIARNGAGNGAASRNTPVDYAVNVTGSGDGINASGFGLSNGNGNFLFYEVFFNDDDGLTGRVQLTAGNILMPQTSSGYDNIANIRNWNQGSGCIYRNVRGVSSGPNANISIIIRESELLKMAADTYTGTLTVTVQPL